MSGVLTEKLTGPAVWGAADFREDTSWAHQLTADEIAVMDAALEALKSRGAVFPKIRREDIALDALEPLFAEIREVLETGRGFMLLRGLPVLYIFLFVFGLRVPMAAHVGSLMTYEMVGQRVRSYATSVLTILDGTTNVWMPVFFYYAKDWRYLFWGSIGLVAIIFLIVTFLVPESPRILIAKQKFAPARRSYAFVARFNRRPMFQQPLQGELL